MAKKKLVKPKPHIRDPIYYYKEIEQYVQEKYNISKDDISDLWEWIVEGGEIHNGIEHQIDFDWSDDPEAYYSEDDVPSNVLKVLKLIQKEFADGEDFLDVYIAW